jgi:chromosome partitioning protein
MGLKVLLIDLDAQSSLSLALGIQGGRVKHSIGEVMLGTTRQLPVLSDCGIPGLDLLPAGREVAMLERYLPTQKNYETILRRILQETTLRYEFVLVDCPPLLGALTLNALVAANLLLAPTQAEYFSIFALRNLMGLLNQVRTLYNPRLAYRLLITLYDQRTRTHRLLHERLRASFEGGVLNTFIEMDTRVREAAIAGKSILTYTSPLHSRPGRAAAQYRDLAQEILAYVRQPNNPTNPTAV